MVGIWFVPLQANDQVLSLCAVRGITARSARRSPFEILDLLASSISGIGQHTPETAISTAKNLATAANHKANIILAGPRIPLILE
jgi:hypothetical protein